MNITEMTYNQLVGNLKVGNISIDDIKKAYTKSRKAANDAIRRIEKSDVPFIRMEKPTFPTSKELKSPRDIIFAMADVNRFRQSDYGTLRGRHKFRDNFLKEINKGRDTPVVTKESYPLWGRFMEWFRVNKIDKLFSSRDTVIEDFFSDSWQELATTSPDEWDELLFDFIREQGDEYGLPL